MLADFFEGFFLGSFAKEVSKARVEGMELPSFFFLFMRSLVSVRFVRICVRA